MAPYNADEREKRVDELLKYIEKDKNEEEQVLDTLEHFVVLFSASFGRILTAINQKRSGFAGELEYDHRKGGRSGFSFRWDDGRILVQPHDFAASPSPDFTIPLGADWAGKLNVFHYPIASGEIVPEHATVIAEIYVRPDSHWYASGVTALRGEGKFDESLIEDFALDLLETLVYNSEVHHLGKEETRYIPKGHHDKPPLGFKSQSAQS
jgi:hypothetical protein